ncbi:transposase [Yimella lutea]|uniref:Transposase n=2 Tax=Yimella lutea TaxID=587872 RepID=A0A542ECM4_9MICO|nr:IS1634 family transposase [Yimella lutea]TQJ12941.1 IS4 family transposase [Yimella lutea]TQJ13082.1 transposase [Yimella lutea]TQJ14779.1 transposase [Yimella lutea]TQJ15465.1 transposase [Yimella lutea]
MVWIRRVRTASGATAVQIAESVNGRRRIVRHVGSARNEADLGLLMEQARALLADDRQGVLDLGITPVAAKAVMVPAARPSGLFMDPEPSSAVSAVPAVSAARPMVSRSRVLKTSSGLLYGALAGVYTDLGFDVVADDIFRDLVIARVVEPTSLLDVDRVLAELGRRAVSLSTRKRTLRRAHQGSYRDQVAVACFEHACTSGDVSLVLYDVTTLYFEAEKEDGLRKVGYSKERRVDPQIVVGLLVDREGFPLEIGCFEGNKAETATIIPIVKQFQERHNIADMVVVADAGMLSTSNLTALDEANLRFIVGSRVTKAPKDLESHFRWHGDAFTDGQLIDTLTPRTGHTVENDPNLKAEPVWDREQHPGSWRAVWAYSAKRAARDSTTLTLQENRAKAVVAGEKAARTPRFVKTTNGSRTLDEASLARARRLVGLKGYVTNIPAELMPASEVIASYHDLWHVEQSFRMSKTDLRARPMFARTRDAIEAHLTIVFTALAVSREVQARTGLSLRRVLRALKPLRSATIEINGVVTTIPPALNSDEAEIIEALERPPSRH